MQAIATNVAAFLSATTTLKTEVKIEVSYNNAAFFSFFNGISEGGDSAKAPAHYKDLSCYRNRAEKQKQYHDVPN